MWKNLWKLCKREKPGTAPGSSEGNDMHTGIIIEQLIATVARVEAKVEKARKIYAAIPRTPAMPFHEPANLFARPGVM
jgi:hypothetical protein